jgi:hypothetical protein
MNDFSLTESMIRPSMGAEPYSGKPRVSVETLLEWLEIGVPTFDDIAKNYLTSADRPRLSDISHEEFREEFLVDMGSHETRDRNAAEIGYVIPCKEALEEIARHGPLLEVGAGTGYWAALIAKTGTDIIATDIQDGSGVYPVHCGVFHEVAAVDAEEAVAAHPDRNLLIIYPTMSDWAERAARKLSPGRTLIFVGEYRGCCANDDFFDLLSREFEQVETLNVPRFAMFHEAMYVFRKRA